LLATGCAGKGERIDLKVPIAYGANEKVAAMSSATVAILPFEDNRTNRSHLGTRYHLWGEESHFSIPSGTLGESTAQAFADYLRGKGWNVTVAKGNGAAGADVTIVRPSPVLEPTRFFGSIQRMPRSYSTNCTTRISRSSWLTPHSTARFSSSGGEHTVSFIP
jgi:hypothetical protein